MPSPTGPTIPGHISVFFFDFRVGVQAVDLLHVEIRLDQSMLCRPLVLEKTAAGGNIVVSVGNLTNSALLYQEAPIFIAERRKHC